MIERSWNTADEWMADFLARCQRRGGKHSRIFAETFVPDPEEIRRRDYDDETEQKLRFIRGRDLQLAVLADRRAKARRSVPSPERQLQIAIAAIIAETAEEEIPVHA